MWRVAPIRRRDGPTGTSAISVSVSALSSPGSRAYDSPGHGRYGTPPGTDRDRRGDRDEQLSSRERGPRSLFSNQGREASWSPSPGNGELAGHGSPGPQQQQQANVNGSGSGYGGYSSDLHGVPEEGEHDPSEADLEDSVLVASVSASLASSRGESAAPGAGAAAGTALGPGENGMQLLEPGP